MAKRQKQAVPTEGQFPRDISAEIARETRSQVPARVPIPFPATHDGRAGMPRHDAEPAVPRSVCCNLSTPPKKSGQVALPSPATRFTVECLLELANLLRRLDERAQAGAEAPARRTEDQPNHGADRAGGPANPGPLGPPGDDRQARANQGAGLIEQ